MRSSFLLRTLVKMNAVAFIGSCKQRSTMWLVSPINVLRVREEVTADGRDCSSYCRSTELISESNEANLMNNSVITLTAWHRSLLPRVILLTPISIVVGIFMKTCISELSNYFRSISPTNLYELITWIIQHCARIISTTVISTKQNIGTLQNTFWRNTCIQEWSAKPDSSVKY